MVLLWAAGLGERAVRRICLLTKSNSIAPGACSAAEYIECKGQQQSALSKSSSQVGDEEAHAVQAKHRLLQDSMLSWPQNLQVTGHLAGRMIMIHECAYTANAARSALMWI